jgi:hypothetical protein
MAIIRRTRPRPAQPLSDPRARPTAGRLWNVQSALVIHCAKGLIAGTIFGGSIHRGVHNYAGSTGHTKINVNDCERCDCDGYGCFEMPVMPRRVLAGAEQLRDKVGKVSLLHVSHRATIECSPLDDDEACTLGAASYVLLHALESGPLRRRPARPQRPG